LIRVVQKNKQFLALLDFANLNVAFKTNLSVNKKVITPQSRIQKSLSNSELIILKSIALGLSCDTIRDLLEISKETYEKHCQNLFQKLDVCNAYAAVQKAYQVNILKSKEFTPEKVKGFALKFAHEYEEHFKSSKEDSKKTIWELYEMLLEFYSNVESSFSQLY